MNVPKLRFKEFNDEWINNCLSDIATITMGQSPSSKNYTSNKNNIILIQGNADLNNGHVVPRIFTTQITKTCNINDIIITVRAPVGDTAISDYNACIGRGVCAISGDKYIYHYLNYLKINDYWKKISKGSTIDSITSNDIKNLNINFPNSTEAKKIVKTLDSLDKKIELQSKKIEDLKLFKKGLNKFIFSNCTDEYKVENLIIEYNDKTTENNQYKVLSSTANGITFQNEYFNKQAASNNNTGYKIIPKGFITYRSMSDTGEFHFNIQDITDIGIVSPAYPVFNIKKNLVNKTYFVYYINENDGFKNEILSTKEGGTRYALSITKFKTLNILLPKIEEQIKYSKYINVIINKIQIEEKKLEKLVQFKKGLMQNMFV